MTIQLSLDLFNRKIDLWQEVTAQRFISEDLYAYLRSQGLDQKYRSWYFAHKWSLEFFLTKIRENIPLMTYEKEIPVDLLFQCRRPLLEACLQTNNRTTNEILSLITNLPEIPISVSKFTLYAFDINNLTTSMHKATPNLRSDPMIAIQQIITGQSEQSRLPAFVHFFASQHLAHLQSKYPKKLPEVIWHIESYRKYNAQFQDIDPLLKGIMVHLIEHSHDQIAEFVLGTGDNDLHIVMDVLQKYHIPLTIIAASAETLNHHLKKRAHKVITLL